VSLPVWVVETERFDKEGPPPWTLGYTRDISAGGSKVIVARGEEARWRMADENNTVCFLRFDVPGMGEVEYITARIRRSGRDVDTGQYWLGLEYEEGTDEVKARILRTGLQTVRTRRRLYTALAGALVLIGLSFAVISGLRADIAVKQQQINKLNQDRSQNQRYLRQLLSPSLVPSRAQGIENAFKSKQVQARISELTADMKRLNDPKNQEAAQQERVQKRQSEGIELSSVPASGANVNLGVAYPYGYAWPQVTSDLEELIGRKVPTIVIFRDFKSPFPLEDCREARLRAKTLQITWEPWLNFSNDSPARLQDIVAGRYDNYIDGWARTAKAFGNELWIRWGHEFNGNWYPWTLAANNKNANLYISAFRHVHDRFTRAGAFNVRWIWCLNAESVPDTSWNDPLRAYPGNDYVDMISIDGYNFGTTLASSRWESFRELFAQPYAKVVSRFPTKPVMVGEVGCATVGGDKAGWIRDMDRSLRKSFPKFQGIVWFEAAKEADWRMASSPDSLLASRLVWAQDYYRRGEP
jgi:hypothetical protein